MEHSPFLAGALDWVYAGDVPDACPQCGYDWSTPAQQALALITESPARYAELLAGRDGMSAAADGGWNATAYVWHLTDLARSWSERWVQVRSSPGSRLVGWDPDDLAGARNYTNLPTVSALWALEESVAVFVSQSAQTDLATAFEHGDWGRGTVGDGIRWLAHEFVHHQLDVDARATPVA